MKLNLLENQVDCILKSLEFFSLLYPEKHQLIYSTFESVQTQKVSYISSLRCNENVTIKLQKKVDSDIS